MKKGLFLIFFLVLLLPMSVFASTDYSKIKGDFKVFCLGDSWETTIEKINYLEYINEIVSEDIFLQEKSYAAFTTTMSFKMVRCSLNYHKNKLYWISIILFKEFQAKDYNTKQKDYITNELIPSFSKLYGKPTHLSNYPTEEEIIEKLGYYDLYWVADWVLKKKTVIVGVSMEGTPGIEIIDNDLAEDIEKNKNETNEFN